MIWLNPSALFALAAVAAPILIHLLVQRRAERVPFPTLRFLQPTRLAAIRRHLLEDLPLLAVRVALLAAAVAALAGPLLLTAARRQAWDRRVVRATVTDTAGVQPAPPGTFENASLADGVRRAVLWLDAAAPARREIVIASPFPIGSITRADLAAIPADVGVRFERTGTLPASRTVSAGRLLSTGGVLAREVTLAGERTSVRDAAAGDPVAWPIDVVSSQADRPAVDAAIAAVLSQRVWAGPSDRRARLVLLPSSAVDAGLKARTTFDVVQASRPGVIVQPWMAAAIAHIARDPDLRTAARRVPAGLSEAAVAAPPWQMVASAADGRPLVVASGSAKGIVVVSAASPSDIATPLLLRSIANAIGAVPDLQRAEVVPIADAVLQRWSRPAAPLTLPRINTVDQDDRRWLWIAVLCLMALEMWIGRRRAADVTSERREDHARVA